jgi:hypothetical protein
MLPTFTTRLDFLVHFQDVSVSANSRIFWFIDNSNGCWVL